MFRLLRRQLRNSEAREMIEGVIELGDAVVYGLQLRHQQNGEYRDILRSFKAAERFGAALDAIGGEAPFESGLYACTEMFVDGFLDLYRKGILRRRVYGDVRIQTLLNDGSIGERIDERFLAALGSPVGGGALSSRAGGPSSSVSRGLSASAQT